MPLTVLPTAADVLAASGHDPVARGSLRVPDVHGWTDGAAVAWVATGADTGEPYLLALGGPGPVADLLLRVRAELRDGQRVTLPRGTAPVLSGMSLRGTDWDFRWLSAPPPVQPGEDAVGPVQGDLVGPLLEASSPRASASPGSSRVRRWVGVQEDGRLLACAADTSAVPGVGHLSSIAVHPQARGRGLGSAVTAALTRRLLADGCDVVTLGMYADNTAGRALYDRLGFADDHPLTSGPLRVPAQG